MLPFPTAARRARLVARHHLGRTAADPATATTDLVALHSSDPVTPHLGLWARVPGYRPEHLHDALTGARSLWRLHAMRRTLWVAPAALGGVLDAAAGRPIAQKERRALEGQLAPEVEGDVAAWMARMEEAVLDATRREPGLSTRALSAALPGLDLQVTLGSGRWTTRASAGPRLLMVMAMDGKVVRTAPGGTWRSSQYGWAAADAWFDALPAPPEPADARVALAGRYLARFGPVTLTDLRWWTGWTKAHAQRALADLGARTVVLDDGEGWVLPGDESPEAAPPSVALLPGLDPTPMGWKERAWFLGPHEAALFDRNGNVGPTAWADGRVVGGWAARADGEVALRLLEDVGGEAEAALRSEAEALQTWLGGTSVTPRFRTPLEKDLSG